MTGKWVEVATGKKNSNRSHCPSATRDITNHRLLSVAVIRLG